MPNQFRPFSRKKGASGSISLGGVSYNVNIEDGEVRLNGKNALPKVMYTTCGNFVYKDTGAPIGVAGNVVEVLTQLFSSGSSELQLA